MVPTAVDVDVDVGMGEVVVEDTDTVPAAGLAPMYWRALAAVVWVLAAAADYAERIPTDHTMEMLVCEAAAGAWTRRKRSAWPCAREWLEHGCGGRQSNGWRPRTPR